MAIQHMTLTEINPGDSDWTYPPLVTVYEVEGAYLFALKKISSWDLIECSIGETFSVFHLKDGRRFELRLLDAPETNLEYLN